MIGGQLNGIWEGFDGKRQQYRRICERIWWLAAQHPQQQGNPVAGGGARCLQPCRRKTRGARRKRWCARERSARREGRRRRGRRWGNSRSARPYRSLPNGDFVKSWHLDSREDTESPGRNKGCIWHGSGSGCGGSSCGCASGADSLRELSPF
jgi:hypothetical protein